jgi:hypothetical protein
VNTLVTGFVTGHQGQDVRLVGQGFDGQGKVDAGVESRKFLFDFVAVAEYFAVEEVGFRGNKAANTPTGDRHLLD